MRGGRPTGGACVWRGGVAVAGLGAAACWRRWQWKMQLDSCG